MCNILEAQLLFDSLKRFICEKLKLPYPYTLLFVQGGSKCDAIETYCRWHTHVNQYWLSCAIQPDRLTDIHPTWNYSFLSSVNSLVSEKWNRLTQLSNHFILAFFIGSQQFKSSSKVSLFSMLKGVTDNTYTYMWVIYSKRWNMYFFRGQDCFM